MNTVLSRFTILPTERNMIISRLKSKNMLPIFDYLLENCPKDTSNYTYVTTVKEHLQEYPMYPFAIKLSAFGNLYTHEQFQEIYKLSNSTIYMDAEQVRVPDHATVDMLRKEYGINFAKTYQMYRKNEIKVLENDIEKYGNNVHYKLVRGAYWREDKDTGLLYTNKEDTNKQYNDAIELSKHLNTVLYATHNEKSLSLVPKGKKVAQLLGMSDLVSEDLAKTHQVYKYVPFGSYRESVPYLMRRLYENAEMIQHLFR